MENIKMSKRLILLALVVSVGLVSCKTHKEMVRPEVDAAALYRSSDSNLGASPTTGDTTTIADIPWKEYFGDAQLQALIAEGLEKNYNLQVAYGRIKQAEASLSMARGANLPTVAIMAQGSGTRISNGNDGTKVLGYNTSTSPVMQLGFTASWEITFGVNWAAKREPSMHPSWLVMNTAT